ncbi:MAG: hypothetical protein JWM71_241 [Solirubrobacteraceae bacterium]|nr:hypothetical protein [Solirubrobacteraceae bacterium]
MFPARRLIAALKPVALAGATLGLVACQGQPAATAAGAQPAGTISLAGGATTIPRRNVGSVDLTKLPLGDGKVSTTPRRGYIDSCRPQPGEPSDGTPDPSWVHGKTWSFEAKLVVEGSVSWPTASFTDTLSGATRTVSGNDLPVGGTTGSFPTQPGTPAHSVRPDPSSIKANDYTFHLPAHPVVNATAHCMAGEVGVLKDGTALFNGFDAENRDAVAQEVLDSCQGHPNNSGYHHHWIPTCLADGGTGQSPLMGYALDGFGIYGHRGAGGRVMTDKDLDACHGITSRVRWNGRWVRMYHYVATWEFPYTVGCFRGTPVVDGPAFR